MFLGPRCSGSSSASPESKWKGKFKQLNESIYELYKPEGTPRMQIVFFHGIYLGDSMEAHFSTWENEDGTLLWPQKWLSEEFPDAHILTASYNGDVGKRSCASFDMHNIVENLMMDIMGAGVGQNPLCPVGLVGHCVGGLVIKQLCLEASSSTGGEKHKSFLNNLRGIFFYATPHQGFFPSYKLTKMRHSPLFDYLPTLKKESARLRHKFNHLRSSYASWRIHALGESLPTKSVHAVYDNNSHFAREYVRIVLANQEIFLLTHEGSSLFPKDEVAVLEASSREGEAFNIVVADHISISRPSSREDRRFYAVKWMLEDVVGKPGSPGRMVASDELTKQEDGDVAQLLKYLSRLSDFGHPVTQGKAAEKLRSLCGNKQDRHAIKLLEEDGAVNMLVKCLSKEGRPRLQENVAWIIDRLSKLGSFVLRITKEGIAKEVIVELVKCLSKDDLPSLQEAAVWTLCHLVAIDGHGLEVVCAKEDLAKIVKDQGAMVLLVKCLLEQKREQKWTDLREAAAYTLGNLAKLGDQYIIAAKEARAIDGLKECLPAHNKPNLRKAANYALGKLGQEFIADLVTSLSKHNDPVEQKQAALALYYLTKRKNESIRLRVAKEEGAILGLMTCLSKRADPDVQERAAWTLCCLFGKGQNDTIRSSIVKEDGAIVELVKWLSNSTSRGMQEAAAWNLCHLTEIDDGHGHFIKSRIAKEVGATTGLVKCLSKNNPTDVRTAAAYTLGNLAKLGDQYIRAAKEAGAIGVLEECSSAYKDPELQKAAGRALCKLKTTTT